MKYKVTVAAHKFRYLAILSLAILIIGMQTSNPYRPILFGLALILTLITFFWFFIVQRRNRTLYFKEAMLVLPTRVIYPREIKRIEVPQHGCYFIVYFKKNRSTPITISFNKSDEKSIRAELRTWLWKNAIKSQTHKLINRVSKGNLK